MKYFMLAQWVMENRNVSLTAEKICLSEANLIVVFKGVSSLVLHFRTSNPFPWFADSKTVDTVAANHLWQGLQNSELYSVRMSDADRIMHFRFRYRDIYQNQVEQVLVFECMPPQGNVILCRPESGKLIIHDAINKYTYADNPQRQILSGLPYETPRTGFAPGSEEVDFPLEVIPADGSAPILCNYVNDYFRSYYELVILQRETAQKKQKLLSHWQKELTKAEKKLALQQKELQEAEQEKTWLAYSEMLKVNLKQMKKGDSYLEAVNYSDSEMRTVRVPLKPELGPQENLKFYLKKYSKARLGRQKISLQMENTGKDIAEIKSILDLFDSDKWQELETGSSKSAETLKKLKQTDSLLRLTINEDWEIVIGRKAKENDLLSTQIGKPNDWWFHTRIYHGSHVLLRNFHKKEPSPQLMELCCGLAAWFSKARNSENVPVDYTQIRYVRKPRKSAPGFVTYTNQKTVFVDPVDVNSAREILSHYGK
jgi:predicted ribosome quality control (RQC) complex YloA/Tae2 family protein